MSSTTVVQRLGILGGTFDPVHYGHLLLAEQCREQCELDQVWLMPARLPPHKQETGITPGRERAEMLRLAVAGDARYAVSTLELERDGPSFTVDTLEALHAQDPSRSLFFLIGADSLHDLPGWRQPERIAELATIVAVNRGDRPLPAVQALLEHVGPRLAGRIRLVTMPGIDIAATDLRARVREGRSLRFQTPRAVEAYIEQHGLYRADGDAA